MLAVTALTGLSLAGAGAASAQLPQVSDLPVVSDLPIVAQLPDVPSLPSAPLPPIPGVSSPAAPDVGGAVNDAVSAPSGSSASPTTGSAGGSGARTGSPRSSGGSSTSASGRAAKTPAARSRARARAARTARARRATAARRASARATAAATRKRPAGKAEGGNAVTRTVREIVKVVPGPVKVLIALLALAALGFAARSRYSARHAKRLERQREQLLGDIGLLQGMLLPEVPPAIGALELSVAYRPAEGPAAGGDFYDVFELDDHRVALMVGDVCGHGPDALGATSLIRYSLRAYLNAGLDPRRALQVAARPLESDPAGALTTVVLAVYDSRAGTLTYACAGHEPPIILGPASHEPVTVCSSPPLGGFMDTGERQTTIALGPGSAACFFTDGLVEARLGETMIGRERLEAMLAELDTADGAQLLLDRLASTADRAPDDMAACLVRTCASAAEGPRERIEELELGEGKFGDARVEEFLLACGLPADHAAEALESARAKASERGSVLLRVLITPDAQRVDVAPAERPPAVALPEAPAPSPLTAA
jgi:serine phosphatase RsbU (regulator of sigma subunit)